MPYRQRHFTERLRKLLKQFPIVCILGPRQCGKTTYACKTFPQWKYFDLERPSDLAQVEDDPEAALDRYPQRVIFDEAQRVPALFSVLRGHVDRHKKKGGIILLGSASLGLVQNVSESLAGRVGFLDMTPFHIEEVEDWRKLWIAGGFPATYFSKNALERHEWFENYTRTFIERDLGNLGIEVSGPQMRKIWTMLSHVHGNIWDASELANSLGNSYHTVNRYVDILEQTFLVRKLSPYFVNIGKRLVRRPKVYLRDSGLLHDFLGISTHDDLDVHPKKGASWEGFVIEQILTYVQLRFPGTQGFFWRTSTGSEVDLIVQKGKTLYPVEIKLKTAPRRSDLTGLIHCMKDLKLSHGYVVRPLGEPYSLGDGIQVVTIQDFFKIINLRNFP